jgi:hypothetical protein
VDQIEVPSERKKPEEKLREKGKKESQVFTPLADNPRRTFSSALQARSRMTFLRDLVVIERGCVSFPHPAPAI